LDKLQCGLFLLVQEQNKNITWRRVYQFNK
jgi:hypothetical protein